MNMRCGKSCHRVLLAYHLSVIYPFLRARPPKSWSNWAKKYGPVYGLQLGLYPAVVLNDWPSIKEALSDDTALYRPKDNFFNSATPRGLTSLSGDVWREHKRFALYELRNLGFGKTAMEDHIIDEINHLSQLLDEKEGQEIDFRNVFPVGVSNNVNFLLFGRRFEYTDSRAHAITEFSKLDPKYDVAGLFAFYPRVTRFAIKHLTFLIPPSLRHINNIFKGMKKIIKSEYETHVKTIDEDNNRDYMDAFINETRKNSDRKTFDYNLLEGNILNLFGAGTGTLLQTLEWALLVLATKPDIQRKLQKEIDEVIGSERTPTFADRKQMPYLHAFSHELWRFRTITPINLPRCAANDMVIAGFKIPKDTHILINMWAIDNDPNVWENPSEFRPERHLSEDHKTFIRAEQLIPFSFGKRSCPGEGLAVVEVFLYLSSLLQKYDIKANHKTDTSLEYLFQFTIAAKREPYVTITKRRK